MFNDWWGRKGFVRKTCAKKKKLNQQIKNATGLWKCIFVCMLVPLNQNIKKSVISKKEEKQALGNVQSYTSYELGRILLWSKGDSWEVCKLEMDRIVEIILINSFAFLLTSLMPVYIFKMIFKLVLEFQRYCDMYGT